MLQEPSVDPENTKYYVSFSEKYPSTPPRASTKRTVNHHHPQQKQSRHSNTKSWHMDHRDTVCISMAATERGGFYQFSSREDVFYCRFSNL